MSPDLDMSPPSGDGLPPALLDRYLRGEISPEEMARVEAWFQAYPDKRVLYARVGEEAKVDLAPDLAPEGWSQLTEAVIAAALRSGVAQASAAVKARGAAVGEEAGILPFPQRPVAVSAELAGPAIVKKLFRAWPQRRLGAYSFRRAGGLGGVLGAAILAGVGLEISGLSLWRRTPAPTLAEVRQYIAVPGRRVTIHLTDGSTVILAPGSTLRTRPQFGIDVRDVYLDGEGYFDIRHNTRMPFRVQTAQGFVEDIGTKFAVRAYVGDTASRVVVAEGKVAVGSGVILGAGDVAFVAASAPPVVRRGVPVRHLLSWTTGQVEFVKTPLHEVVADLARWYGVAIRVDDPVLAQYTVTATFPEMSADAVLESLARTVGARLEQHGVVHVLVPTTPGAVRHVP